MSGLVNPLAQVPNTREECGYYVAYVAASSDDANNRFNEAIRNNTEGSISPSNLGALAFYAGFKGGEQVGYVEMAEERGMTPDLDELTLPDFCEACGKCTINDLLAPYGLRVDV